MFASSLRPALRLRLTLVPTLILLALAAAPALGEEPLGDYVTVKTYTDRDLYRQGETARIAVEMRIDSRVHVNSNAPKDEFAIPTSLKWAEVPAGLTLGEITWPKADWKAFEFTDGEKIPVYEGRQRAYLSARIPADAEPGSTIKVEGTFKAQGCTHAACYAPQKDKVTLKLRIATADDEPAPINESKFPAGAAGQ
jgi:hypothetical protein